MLFNNCPNVNEMGISMLFPRRNFALKKCEETCGYLKTAAPLLTDVIFVFLHVEKSQLNESLQMSQIVEVNVASFGNI